MGCEKIVDLHIHSEYSDGAKIEEIVSEAKKRRISSLALCDHQDWRGIAVLEEKMRESGYECEIIHGVEILTFDGVDILGYHVDTSNKGLTARLLEVQDGKRKRTKKILEKFNGFLQKYELPIQVSFEEAAAYARHENVLSGHIEACFYEKLRNIKSQGKEIYIHTVAQISKALNAIDSELPGETLSLLTFDLNARDSKKAVKENIVRKGFLRKGSPCYVLRTTDDCMSEVEAINLIKTAGGVPGIAHPGAQKLTKDELYALHEIGARTLEVISSKHTQEQNEMYIELAKELRFMPTAGSDWHGSNTPTIRIGEAGIITLKSNLFNGDMAKELKELKKQMYD